MPLTGRYLFLVHLVMLKSLNEVASLIWSPSQKNHSKTIENIQAKFSRYLFKKVNNFYPTYPEQISYSLLIENLDLLKLEDRRELEKMKFLYKIINNNIDAPQILSKISFKVPRPGLRQRNLFFDIQNNISPKSPITSSMKTFNNLDIKPDFSLNYNDFTDFLNSQ